MAPEVLYLGSPCYSPGSTRLAEFRNGSFFDLDLPKDDIPSALAADRAAHPICLVQKDQSQLKNIKDLDKQWLMRLGDHG